MPGLSAWGALQRYLAQIQKFGDKAAQHKAEMLEFAILPHIYSLSADEIHYLADFLDCYPDELPLWLRMFGKTPSQFSNTAVTEAVERGLLTEDEARDVRRKLSIGRTWELLITRLRAGVIVQALDDQPLADYIDLLRTLIDGLPQRHDHYDAHRQPQEAENWAAVPFSGSGEFGKEMEECAGTDGFTLPPKTEGRCRLCWRPVPHNPRTPYRQQPCCPLHDFMATDPAYRSRIAKRCEMEALRRSLTQAHKEAYQATANAAEAWAFVRKLLLAEDSPLPHLAAYMRKHCRAEAHAEELLWAFCGPKDEITNAAYLVDLEQFIAYAAKMPLPITFADCITAEAWMLATRDKRRKSG